VIGGIFARARSLWAGIARARSIDDEMQEEFRLHMELRAADLARSGLTPEDAARRARVEFGGTYHYKEAGRDARGLRWWDALSVSWLDIKLGARMLARYPGLTLVGATAMGVAIAFGAGVLGLIALLKDPRLPLDEGERIVGIQVWSVTTHNPERRIAHDFMLWRNELRTVDDVSAFRVVTRNLVSPDGRAEPVQGAAMSAAGFRVARVAPMLGRYLVGDDEREGARPVAVLGYDLWRARFGADSAIVGNQIQLGGAAHTVVGVMPDGFRFPVNFQLWLPLRVNQSALQPRQGPVLYGFGRLAPSASLEEARAEVSALGARISQAFPQTHRMLRPRLLPFAQSWFELDSPETILMYRAGQVAVTLLLIIICVNVAILVYARTATRQGEIAVRSALGASRFRIVGQLFGEALVFAGMGAAIGLAIIAVVVTQAASAVVQIGLDNFVPFWVRIEVSRATVAYLVGLSVLGAAIIGVLPALQVTGRRVQANLRRLSGGNSTVRMGRLWTSMIIAEVALTVGILPTAVFFGAEAIKAMTTAPGFAAEQYLSGVVSLDREVRDTAPTPEQDRAFGLRFARQRDEVIRRLGEEPGVRAVTFAADVPGVESSERIELDGTSVPFVSTVGVETKSFRYGANAIRVRRGVVDPTFFDAFEVPVLAGRTFGPADADSTSTAAIVNRAFVQTVLQGRNAIGQRFRMLRIGNDGEELRGPWQQIVGVVDNFPAHVDYERPKGVWYTAARSALGQPSILAVRMRGDDPAEFGSRLRAIAARVEPGFQIRDVQPMDDVIRASHLPLRLVALILIAITLSVLVLAAAGLYSLMSVIVTQRRREIGIRIALGADRRRVLSSIFSRAALQVGVGVAIGMLVALLVNRGMSGEMQGLNAWLILPGVAMLMLAVGVVAAIGPARRGLRIQPITVLKED
jgi:putative ABC transport system permease protein